MERVALKTILAILCCLLWQPSAHAQKLGVKTNLLYGATAFAPNLGMEVKLNKHSTLDFGAGYNGWNRNGSPDNNKKLVHWLAQAEYRYWLCSTFSGHFFGVHALGSQFNIGGHELPMLFGKGSKEFRYEGWGAGAGVSYGYNFYLGKRWGLEATIGVGYARLQYNKYDCVECGKKIGPQTRNYFGPTKAGISLVYIIK